MLGPLDNILALLSIDQLTFVKLSACPAGQHLDLLSIGQNPLVKLSIGQKAEG